MPARFLYWLTLVRVATLGFAIGALWFPLWGQQMQPPGVPTTDPFSQPEAMRLGFDLDIFVRDSHGNPLDVAAVVHLSSPRLKYDAVSPAQGASAAAHFANLALGEYAVEVTCPGFRKTTEQFSAELNRGSLPVYIYLVPESGLANSAAHAGASALTQQQRADMQLGIGALNRERYASAGKTFAKILRKAPGNSDVVYFLGAAELGLKHPEVAREDYQRALSLDPNNELALVSLGQMLLDGGAPANAVIPLEKAVSLGRAGWRADFELASAYFQLHRLSEAESAASRAVSLAKEKGATSLYLLGEIQYAEGKRADAKHSLESLLKFFPKDSAVFTTRKMLERMESEGLDSAPPSEASLPAPPAPETNPSTYVEVPWAPRDTDDAAYVVAPGVNCNAQEVLDGALHRMNSDLAGFEKFTATEHIEHQEIDGYGWPGPIKTHDFSYVVFVHPLGKSSFYLEEFRDGAVAVPGFSDVIMSTGLNTLGVNVLEPYYRDRFAYSCEGLANVRGQAAWQIRFEEKHDAKGGGIRTWRAGSGTYNVAIKGRMWISGASYAVLRVETDLREPIAVLGLTKDHLLVDYGLVNFSTGNVQLWLPWSADMYMAFRGKRYHHRHFLSNYLLFDVDATHKIGKPAEPPPPPDESAP